jgi:hypothetical protein
MAPTVLDWAHEQHRTYAKSPSLNPDGTINEDGPRTYGDKTAVNRNAKQMDIGLGTLLENLAVQLLRLIS